MPWVLGKSESLILIGWMIAHINIQQMLDLLKDCCNCLSISLVKKIEMNIYSTTIFNFLLRKVFESYQV